jgi:hypothetical protein
MIPKFLVPLLENDLARFRTNLSCHQLFEVANRILGAKRDANYYA